jgi:hypothetical protein
MKVTPVLKHGWPPETYNPVMISVPKGDFDMLIESNYNAIKEIERERDRSLRMEIEFRTALDMASQEIRMAITGKPEPPDGWPYHFIVRARRDRTTEQNR